MRTLGHMKYLIPRVEASLVPEDLNIFTTNMLPTFPFPARLTRRAPRFRCCDCPITDFPFYSGRSITTHTGAVPCLHQPAQPTAFDHFLKPGNSVGVSMSVSPRETLREDTRRHNDSRLRSRSIRGQSSGCLFCGWRRYIWRLGLFPPRKKMQVLQDSLVVTIKTPNSHRHKISFFPRMLTPVCEGRPTEAAKHPLRVRRMVRSEDAADATMRLVGEERLGMGFIPVQRNSEPCG